MINVTANSLGRFLIINTLLMAADQTKSSQNLKKAVKIVKKKNKTKQNKKNTDNRRFSSTTDNDQ